MLINNGNSEDQRLEENRQCLITLAKLETITWLAEGDKVPMSATSLVKQMEILVPMAGLIDKQAETIRLSKRN